MKRAVAMLVVLTWVLTGCAPDRAPEQAASRETHQANEKEPKPQGRSDGRHGKTDRSLVGGNKTGNQDPEEQSTEENGEQAPGGPEIRSAERTRDPSRERRPTQAAAPRAPLPIPEGRHEYETDGRRTVSGNTQPMPATTVLIADTPNDQLQRQIRDLRNEDGHGTVTEMHLLYQPDGVRLSYVKVTSSFPGGFTDVREFRLREPVLIAPTGSGPGFERRFTMSGSGTRAEVSIAAIRYDKLTTAGRRIRSLVVQTDITFSGALEGEQRSVSWYWPDHLWAVKEHVETDVRNGPIRLQSEYDAWLR